MSTFFSSQIEYLDVQAGQLWEAYDTRDHAKEKAPTRKPFRLWPAWKVSTPGLQAHFNIGFYACLNEAQMRRLISVLKAKDGRKEAENAFEILGKVLSGRAK